MEGFLLKSPEAKQDLATLDGFSMAQWRRRFFVLVDDRVEYFVDESRKERKGEIRLSHDAFVTGHLGVANHPHMLELTTNYRTYYLQADSAGEHDEWLKALNVCIAELRSHVARVQHVMQVIDGPDQVAGFEDWSAASTNPTPATERDEYYS
eukprot:m.11892 g.11892  ORF g.11892 m.11892 type:complete len:152 (-) comp3187_c0_seq2:268-723(-)